MELHRLDGLDATGLDYTDIHDIDLPTGMGFLEEPEIAYELLDNKGNVMMYADLEENIYVIDGLSGFFKKIGKGLKRFGKKVVKPIVKTFNRFLNPATILLRNGFLLSMKLNLFKVAKRIRWGYLSEAAAKKKGIDMKKFARLKKIVRKAEKIFSMAGGRTRNLRKAILKGKGNKDRAVPMNGLALGNIDDTPLIYNDPFEKFVIESDVDVVEAFVRGEVETDNLGFVVSATTGTSIAAASSAVAGIAALLGKVGNVFGKAKQVKAQAQSLFKKPKRPAPYQPPTPRHLPSPIPRGVSPMARRSFTSRRGRSLPSSVIQSTIANRNKSTNDDDKNFLQRYKTPLLIGGIGIVAGGLYYAFQSNKKQSKSISGIPKKRKATNRDTLGRFVKGHTTTRKRKTKRKQPKRLVAKALL